MIYNKTSVSYLKKGVSKFLMLMSFLISSHLVNAQSTDVTVKQIKFNNKGADLAGTILKPKHSKVGIVLVHGSGQESRAMQFASLLANHGICVLTYDKRGVGESGGVYAGPEVGTNNIDSANLNLLAEDTQEAVRTLDHFLGDRHLKIGLLGFSQAGWIIPLAANKCPKVDFMVIFSGAVVTAREQLRFQFFTQGKTDFWDVHTENQVREHIRTAPDKYQFTDTDPQNALNAISIPGLWLFGAKDIQVPVGLSIEHLNALKLRGKDFEYCLFPQLGHNLSSSRSSDPINIALQWIDNINQK